MKTITQLLSIMERLRSPEGCPWDRDQTHESLKMQLIEECYETLDAIDSKNPHELKEELGDLLLHIVFHTQIAKEAGEFSFEEVAEKLCEKLIRRHPHVFGEDTAEDSKEVLKKWHEIKKKEKPERTSLMDGIPRHLPAAMYAHELQKRAKRVGFDWETPTAVFEKVEEEIQELKQAKEQGDQSSTQEELGDVLFSLVNLSRHLGYQAEEALSRSNKKFEKRFRWMEAHLTSQGKTMEELSLEEMEEVWQTAKIEEEKQP